MGLTRSLTKAEWQFVGGLAILLGCACAPSRPTPLDFSGEWAGTTSQAQPISFTISPDLRITALSIDYSFGACTGGLRASPNVALLNTSGTATALVTYTPNGPAGPSPTTVHFLFPSVTSANGTVEFTNYPNCGSANATWTANRR